MAATDQTLTSEYSRPEARSNIRPNILNYDEEAGRLNSLITDWEREEGCIDSFVDYQGTNTGKAALRREVRRFDVNVSEKLAQGVIKADETYIPIRFIDSSIKRDKPGLLAYIEQGRRLLIFTDIEDPSRPCEDLEIAFTKAMRFKDWQIPWHKVVDGSCLHGLTFVEVVYDPSKPLNVGIEYIPREQLIYPIRARSIQSCERIARVYEFMPHQLENFITEHGFDKTQVAMLVTEEKRNEPVQIYKVFIKIKGIVFVGWYSKKCSNWLKPLIPLDLGIVELMEAFAWRLGQVEAPPNPLPINFYPVFGLPYEVTEDEILLRIKGRAAKDLNAQDALTHLWTNVVNATTRASGIYGSTTNLPDTEPVDAKQSYALKSGEIIGREVGFWQPPWPNPVILQVAQALAVEKQQESGQVNFAAQNRDDSRKTATEIEASSRQAALISSVSVVTLSITIRDVYTLCWEIAQSQIVLGAVDDFSIPPEKVARNYYLTAAGDVDVVQREQKKQMLQQFWPLIQNTPLAGPYLSYMVEQFFPEEAARWTGMLQGPNPQQLQAVVTQLTSVLESMPTEGMSDEQKQQLQGIIQSAQSTIGVGGQPMAQQQGNGASPTPPPPAESRATNESKAAGPRYL